MNTIEPIEIEENTLHHISLKPTCTIDGENARLVDLADEYMAIYMPGRTVYIDSVSGSQYRPAEYFILHIEEINGHEYWAREIMRFARSAL